MDLFKHKDQKQFYSDYAIKDGQALNEENLNLSLRRIKKETDNAYNIMAMLAGFQTIAYSPFASYEYGEIVYYNNQDYICIKNSQGNDPTNTEYWEPCTEAIREQLGIGDLTDYLSKTNQTPYNPEKLTTGESTSQYHPATVKFVEDRIEWNLKNSVITNADRLDGYHASEFVRDAQLQEVKATLDKDIADTNAVIENYRETIFEPYVLPFKSTKITEIVNTDANNFSSILNPADFDLIYNCMVNTPVKEMFLRGTQTYKQVMTSYHSEDAANATKTIALTFAGPFEGLGVNDDDYVNGLIGLTITKSDTDNLYASIKVESNCMKILTRAEYDAIATKSDYVQYNVTDDVPGPNAVEQAAEYTDQKVAETLASAKTYADEKDAALKTTIDADIKNLESTLKTYVDDNDKIVPYNIPFLISDMNTITTTTPENFTEVLTSVGFDELYSTIKDLTKSDLRFNSNQNRVIASYVTEDAGASTKTIRLAIAGPFEGFGTIAGDSTNGSIALQIVRNNDGTYASIEVESNCLKHLTKAEYDAITTKSDYVQYNVTDDTIGIKFISLAEETNTTNIATNAANITTLNTEVATYTKSFEILKRTIAAGKSLITIVQDAGNPDPAACLSVQNDLVGMSRDQIISWLGLAPILFKNGGEEGELNPNNFAQFKNGTTADITTLGNDVMLRQPARAWRIWKEAGKTYRQLTDDLNAPGFAKYAFIDTSGNLKNNLYTGIYEAYASGGMLYSSSGKSPTTSTTRTDFRKYAQARGSGYGITGWFPLLYRQLCYLFVIQNLNSQTAVGWGNSNSTAYSTYYAKTTGLLNDKGAIYGTQVNTDAVKCNYLENPWGSCWEFVDQYHLDAGLTPLVTTGVPNDTGSGYQNYGRTLPNANCVTGNPIRECADTNELGFFPAYTMGGSNTTYYSDNFWYASNSAGCLAVCSGSWADSALSGIFCLNSYDAVTSSHTHVGARVQFL